MAKEWVGLTQFYGRFIGKKLKYLCPDGKIREGKLVNIEYSDVYRQPTANFRRYGDINILWKKTETVTLHDIDIKDRQNSPQLEVSLNQTLQNCPRVSKDPAHYGEVYKYGDKIYNRTKWPGLGVGQEVVWTLRGKFSDGPMSHYHGVVKFIGECVSNEGLSAIHAVVQFDQVTNTLPGYISKFPLNRNIIHVSELQCLATWISKNTEDNHEPVVQSSKSSYPSLILDTNDAVKDHTPIVLPASKSEPEAGIPYKCHDDSSVSEPKTSTTHKDQKPKTKNCPENSPVSEIHTAATGESQMQGIQGRNNSCYMDAVLFALFAYNITFDHLLLSPGMVEEGLQKKIRTTLKNHIVSPLRKDCFVPYENIHRLRNILARNGTPEYLSNFMDAEEFLVTMFELMRCPELFHYSTGEGDFVHQVVTRIVTPGHCKNERVIRTTQNLLEESFELSEVKLTGRPKSAFIIKMPVSNGKLIGCHGVVPDLTLNMLPIMDKSTESENVKMSLSAIICLKQNHFVSIARTGNEEDSPWIFMDSNPTQSLPRVKLVDNLSHELMVRHVLLNSAGPKEPKLSSLNVDRYDILTDSYMLIYV